MMNRNAQCGDTAEDVASREVLWGDDDFSDISDEVYEMDFDLVGDYLVAGDYLGNRG